MGGDEVVLEICSYASPAHHATARWVYFNLVVVAHMLVKDFRGTSFLRGRGGVEGVLEICSCAFPQFIAYLHVCLEGVGCR